MRPLNPEEIRQCGELIDTLMSALMDSKAPAEVAFPALVKVVCAYGAAMHNKNDFLTQMAMQYDYESFFRPDPEEIH